MYILSIFDFVTIVRIRLLLAPLNWTWGVLELATYKLTSDHFPRRNYVVQNASTVLAQDHF